ncbi:NADH dehydrogenase [ubiquinone] 1 alpha subcomplex subunit 2 isoform X1 [Anas platyrhynchos]|uniref:NADH dehydrogenase [ubiquinone] 1 alpha subcomplex subunit 2 isoform X1 n=1 Tax=Anas platyrhynchos TaxID=8839 RepID=UPI003AF28922
MAAAAVRGIGAGLGRGVRELRLHLCQSSAGSRGVREFIEQHYVALKQANPGFPILIRECSGVRPRLWARYEFGGGRRGRGAARLLRLSPHGSAALGAAVGLGAGRLPAPRGGGGGPAPPVAAAAAARAAPGRPRRPPRASPAAAS